MSTKCCVAVKNNDGSFDHIFVKWDGCPSYTGELLVGQYKTEEAARNLLADGDLSIVGLKIEPKEPLVGGKDAPSNSADMGTMINTCRPASWVYIFDDGKWLCSKTNEIEFHDINHWLKLN